MSRRSQIAAVVWDFDGTLVDSRAKNRAVTLKILPRVTDRPLDSIPALTSQDTYDDAVERSHDWRELYRREFGLSAEETERAGALWEAEHLVDPGVSPFFDGIADVVRGLHVPQAVVSQNVRHLIAATLRGAGLDDYFEIVIGHEEVPHDAQKPHPQGLLQCLDHLGLLDNGRPDNGPPPRVLYVGDHEVDMLCVQQTNLALEAKGHALRTESVRVGWGPTQWVEGPTRATWHADVPRQVLELATNSQ